MENIKKEQVTERWDFKHEDNNYHLKTITFEGRKPIYIIHNLDCSQKDTRLKNDSKEVKAIIKEFEEQRENVNKGVNECCQYFVSKLDRIESIITEE